MTWVNDVLDDSAAPARARRRSLDEMARIPLPKLPAIGKGHGIKKKGRKARKSSAGGADASKGVSVHHSLLCNVLSSLYSLQTGTAVHAATPTRASWAIAQPHVAAGLREAWADLKCWIHLVGWCFQWMLHQLDLLVL